MAMSADVEIVTPVPHWPSKGNQVEPIAGRKEWQTYRQRRKEWQESWSYQRPAGGPTHPSGRSSPTARRCRGRAKQRGL